MLADGAMEGVQALFGLHVFQAWKVGKHRGCASGSPHGRSWPSWRWRCWAKAAMAQIPTSERCDLDFAGAGWWSGPAGGDQPPPRRLQPVWSLRADEGGKAFNVNRRTRAPARNRSLVSTPTVHAQLPGLDRRQPSRPSARG